MRLAAWIMLGIWLTASAGAAQAQAVQRRVPLHKAPATAVTGTVNRDVLALYDGRTEPGPHATRIHKLLEMPLNHLGFRVQYWDLAAGLPPKELAARQRAVVTWFAGAIDNAGGYLEWAATTARSGVRFIVLESPGALGSDAELPAINAFLGQLGVEYVAYYVSKPDEVRIVERDALMVEFEQTLDPSMLAHQVVRTRGAATRRHLVLRHPEHVWAKVADSTAVATGPGGGFVAGGFATHYDAATDRLRWIVNPFAFLAAALGTGIGPVPDTTTVSGRRIYFSHIDGDGWTNTTEIAAFRDAGAVSADVVASELIAPWPDLPVSVGLIASDTRPERDASGRAGQIAQRLFAMPQVEVASHTHTHPFNWSFYREYSREREMQRLLAERAPEAQLADRSLAGVIRYLQETSPGGKINFASGGAALPRADMQDAFNLELEVDGALRASESFAPKGKRAELYLWSGDTSPFEAAVRATRAAGVRNLNGGDSRFDADHPSVAYVPPIGKPVGAERQIYAANSNENTYTNEWTGPFDGFSRLAETVARTEHPRRLKPFNVYYHMFSGSRPESLEAVRKNLSLARASRIAPIAASDYAGIADSFYDVEIVADGPSAWRVTNRGTLDTVRFDAADALTIDYAKSHGVVGHTHHAGSLYATLDPAVPEARVTVVAAGRQRESTRPYLIDSRWRLSHVSAAACRIAGRASGFGAGETTWAGLRPGRHRVSVTRMDGGPAQTFEATVPGHGTLSLDLSGDGIAGVAFEIVCIDPQPVAERNDAGQAADRLPVPPAAVPAAPQKQRVRTVAATPPPPPREPPASGPAPPSKAPALAATAAVPVVKAAIRRDTTVAKKPGGKSPAGPPIEFNATR